MRPNVASWGQKRLSLAALKITFTFSSISAAKSRSRSSSKNSSAYQTDLCGLTQGGDFQWQAGYGAFSVSHRDVDAVREYIANQEQHHKTISFVDEFLQILREHDAVYDERYLWD